MTIEQKICDLCRHQGVNCGEWVSSLTGLRPPRQWYRRTRPSSCRLIRSSDSRLITTLLLSLLLLLLFQLSLLLLLLMSELPPVPVFDTPTPPTPFDAQNRPRDRMRIPIRFLRVLLKMLVRHLRLANNPKFGTRLYITPWDHHVLNKIRLTLSWVEGHRVLYLNYFQVLKLFKKYCRVWYRNYYNLRVQGYEDIIIN